MNKSNSLQLCSGPVVTLDLYSSLSGGKLQTCIESNNSGEGDGEEDSADMWGGQKNGSYNDVSTFEIVHKRCSWKSMESMKQLASSELRNCVPTNKSSKKGLWNSNVSSESPINFAREIVTIVTVEAKTAWVVV